MRSWLVLVVALSGALSGCMATDSTTSPRERDSCHIQGCSSQLCSDRDDVATTCEWRDVYACYDKAMCERQRDGACGWTPSQELDACLAAYAPTR